MLNSKKVVLSKEKEAGWQEKIVQIRRVTKVVKGGKKLSFRAVVIVGDGQGQVGVGVGKSSDVVGAVKKATVDSKKYLLRVFLTKNNSIPHSVVGRFGAAKLLLKPCAPGSGVLAGGSVRIILKSLGIQNALAKQLGSSNLLNNAHATMLALSQVSNSTQESRFMRT